MQLDGKVIDILIQSQIKDNGVYFSKQMDRKLYEKIKVVLSSLGGKWNRKNNAFSFCYDPAAEIAYIIDSKEAPKKNPNAFFPTPKELVMMMMQYADMYWGDVIIPYDGNHIKILEPSAGHGAVADYIKIAFPNATLDLVEFNPTNQRTLKTKGYAPYECDFMKFNMDYTMKYTYIFMNPPFSLNGKRNLYIDHVLHAYAMLEDHGTLIAIVPSSFLRNKTKYERDFYNLVASQLNLEIIKPGAFEDTKVETVMFKLDKREPCYNNGYANYVSYSFFLSFTNNKSLNDKFWEVLEAIHSEKGSFDKKVMSTTFESFIDELKKENVFYPYSEIGNYLSDAKRYYDYEYSSEPDNTSSKSIKQILAESPTLFEFANLSS